MISLAALTVEPSDLTILTLGVTVVGCFAFWRFAHWLLDGPTSPEPWGDQVAAAIAQEEATPICCRCLLPQEPPSTGSCSCGTSEASILPAQTTER